MSYDNDFSRYHSKPEIKDLGIDVAPKVFELLDVSPEMNEFIRIFDQKDDLILVHYIETIPQLYHIRGIIIDLQQMKIVASSFPYTPEYEIDKIEEAITTAPPYTFAYTNEGTIMRVFNHNNTWYLSTHKKIDGSRSKWSGPCFGTTFKELWGDADFDTILSPENCYVFLVTHPDNRLVSPIVEPSLTYICAFTPFKDNRMRINRDIRIGVLNIDTNNTVSSVDTLEELTDVANDMDWKQCTGLVVFDETDTFIRCTKILPRDYSDRREIRGNEPNFRLRYLHLLQNNKGGLIRDMFPEKENIFNNVDEDLQKVPSYLAGFYRTRYINKTYLQLPQELHYVLNTTKKRFKHDMTIEDNINRTLKYTNGRQLNAIIRYMKNPSVDLTTE